MKVKATHCGHCQVCNRVQKLPDGLLAKHGYNVLQGYFEGTCFGSANLPLEQDKKIVERSITWAEQRKTEFQTQIEIWSQTATEEKGWFNEYVSGPGRMPSRYIWRYVPLSRQTRTINDYTFNEDTFLGYDSKPQPLRRYSISGDTLLDIANQLNQKYVEQFLKKAVRDMTEYIRDQKHRITVWHAQPLLPIEKP